MRMEEKQYYTTVQQEAALLEMGIKPETADMYRIPKVGGYMITTEKATNAKPCWTLARLLDILPRQITDKEDCLVYDRQITGDAVDYCCVDYDLWADGFSNGTLFENVIACISDFIKKGYIDKGFLK